MNILEKFKVFLSGEDEMSTATLEDGQVVEYKTLEEGSVIDVIVDGEKTILKDGLYVIDGNNVTVTDGSISLVEVVEAEEEKEEKEKEVETEMEIEDETEKEKIAEEEKEVVGMSLHEEQELRFSSLETKLVQFEEAMELILAKFEKDTDEFNKFEKYTEEVKKFITDEVEKIDKDLITPTSKTGDFVDIKKNLTFSEKFQMFK